MADGWWQSTATWLDTNYYYYAQWNNDILMRSTQFSCCRALLSCILFGCILPANSISLFMVRVFFSPRLFGELASAACVSQMEIMTPKICKYEFVPANELNFSAITQIEIDKIIPSIMECNYVNHISSYGMREAKAKKMQISEKWTRWQRSFFFHSASNSDCKLIIIIIILCGYKFHFPPWININASARIFFHTFSEIFEISLQCGYLSYLSSLSIKLVIQMLMIPLIVNARACVRVFASEMNSNEGRPFISLLHLCIMHMEHRLCLRRFLRLDTKNEQTINFVAANKRKLFLLILTRCLSLMPASQNSDQNTSQYVNEYDEASVSCEERRKFFRLNCNCCLRRCELAFTISFALFSNWNQNQRFNWPKPICLDDISPFLVALHHSKSQNVVAGTLEIN